MKFGCIWGRLQRTGSTLLNLSRQRSTFGDHYAGRSCRLMEILTFSSTPNRLMRLINRVRAITLTEEGADFLDIFAFFRDKGMDKEESYNLTSRLFRGSIAVVAFYQRPDLY